MGKPIWGKWANDHNSAQLEVWTLPQNFEKIRQAVTEIWVPKCLEAARPDRDAEG